MRGGHLRQPILGVVGGRYLIRRSGVPEMDMRRRAIVLGLAARQISSSSSDSLSAHDIGQTDPGAAQRQVHGLYHFDLLFSAFFLVFLFSFAVSPPVLPQVQGLYQTEVLRPIAGAGVTVSEPGGP